MSTSTDAAAGAQIAPWKIVALWTVPAILSTTETVIFSGRAGHPIAVWRAFVGEAPQWYGWAILMPPIVALASRYPLLRPVRAAAIGVHAVASIVAGLALAMADALVNAWVRPSPASFVSDLRDWFIGGLPATTFVYFAIVVATYAWKNTAELRRREREALGLEAQLREAQLDALRMQLQPHFLFNRWRTRSSTACCRGEARTRSRSRRTRTRQCSRSRCAMTGVVYQARGRTERERGWAFPTPGDASSECMARGLRSTSRTPRRPRAWSFASGSRSTAQPRDP